MVRQAYSTRAEFRQQTNYLQGINQRMGGVVGQSTQPQRLDRALSRMQLTQSLLWSTAAQVPALNSIIGMINSRRRRDSVIMGSVIGVCTLLLLWFIFG